MARQAKFGKRPQQYRLQYPLTPEDVENIDTMFETLFKRVDAAQLGIQAVSDTSSAAAAAATAALLAAGDDIGSEPPIFPGAVGPTGATGPAGRDAFAILFPPEASDEPALMPTIPTAIALSQTTTSTGTQNDLAIPTGCTLLRCNNASLLTITGLSAGVDGQLLDIVSVGAGQVDLKHQDTGSAAANRLINFATSAATSLAAGVGTATLRYDGTTSRWRLVTHDQGDWITPSFSAGDFTASGGGTWTVASGDRVAMLYYLRGRQLTLAFQIDTSTVSGSPLFLQIGNAQWGGFTAATAGFYGSMGFAADNGVFPTAAYVRNTVATTVDCGLSAVVAWANSTDLTYVRATITFQVT